ncbi:MAG TPA: transcriptional repressor LexA [Candidatus Binatia bacterium]
MISSSTHVTNGYMTPKELARLRKKELGLTQEQLSEQLRTTRVSIARYEAGQRRIPPAVELLVKQLCQKTSLPMAGIVAAGKPIEPVEQRDLVDVPPGMSAGKDTFVLKVAGESMRDDGILPGDLVVVRRQNSARTGDRVVALINGDATIKSYHQRGSSIELRPMNETMKPIVIKPTDNLQIQGVVAGLLRYYR